MLNSSQEEYRMMFEAEETLWWYRILHEKVLAQIDAIYPQQKDISILDIGCGTGGLLHFLRKNGYQNIQGIDYSEAAIKFCKDRNLPVNHLSINAIGDFFVTQKFDVIVCNDVFYCLDKSQIENAFQAISALLKPSAIFISNNNAFNVFYGSHDIAVGGKHRFTIQDFGKILANVPLIMTYYSYWTWLLSPLVLSIRLAQRIGLALQIIDANKVVSDVEVPSILVNKICYQLVKLEEKILKKGFFGSSIFMVIMPK
jgi:2-polyprenyl-3-methyl-5-hydroxy-6-metoxy-1,4-benzoquinol methylase